MAQNLELDVAVKLSLDNASRDIFDDIEKSAKETKSKVDKAFNFGKALLSIKAVETSIRALSGAIVGMTKITLKLTTTVVQGFTKISGKILKVASDISGLSAIINGIKSGFIAIGNTISNAISNINFTELLKESSELASSLTEVDNVITQVFGESKEEIKNFAKDAVRNLGMTTLSAEQFAGKFGAALTTTGQSTKDIKNMSIALTQLTADLASFYDIDQEIAAEKLFSGVISGQIKPMRELGVDMTVASLSAYALSAGYSKLYNDMSAAEKQALRFEYVMTKLSMVHGDYARTINSTANQMRLLKNQIKELGSVIGAIINSFFNPLLQVLNRILAAITNVVKTIASVMGIDWSLGTGTGGGVPTLEGVANSYDDIADSAEDLSEAEDAVANSTSKAAKEAKKALAPFHKLNVLQNKASDTVSGSDKKDIGLSGKKDSGLSGKKDNVLSGLTDGVLGIGDAIGNKLPSIKSMISKFFDWLWGLDWEGKMSELTKKINEFFKNAPKAVQSFFDNLQPWISRAVKLLNQFIDEVDWKQVGTTASEILEGLGRSLATAFENFDFENAGVKFADFANGLIDNVDMFKQWGRAVGLAIDGAFRFILNSAKNIKWGELGKNLYEYLKNAVKNINPDNIYDAIYETLSGITESLNKFFENLRNDKETQSKISKDIYALITSAADYLGTDGFSELVDNVADFIIKGLGMLSTALKAGKAPIKKAIIEVINAAGRVLSSNEFKDLSSTIWDIVSTAINEFFSNKKIPLGLKLFAAEELTNLAGLDTILGNIVKLISQIILFLDEIASKITELIKPVIEAIFGYIGNYIGQVITGFVLLGAYARNAVQTIAEKFSELPTLVGEKLSEFVNWFNETIWIPLSNSVSNFVINVEKFFTDLYTNITTLWGNFTSWFETVVWSPLVSRVTDVTSQIRDYFNNLWGNIQGIWSAVSSWFSDAVWNPIITSVNNLAESVRTLFTKLWSDIQAVWGIVVEWFESNIWNPLLTSVTNITEAIEEAFISKVDSIKDGWISIKETVGDVINKIKEWIKDLIEAVNDLVDKLKDAASIKLSNVTSKVKRFITGGSSRRVPGYANGAVLQPNKPHLALLGDQRSGINIESPLSTMVEAFKTAAQNIEGGFSGNITIPVYVDGVLTTQKVITAEQMHNYRSNGR